MTDRELRAAAIGIITYCSLCQSDDPPRLNVDGELSLDASALLDEGIYEKSLSICSCVNLDSITLFSLDQNE